MEKGDATPWPYVVEVTPIDDLVDRAAIEARWGAVAARRADRVGNYHGATAFSLRVPDELLQ